MSASATPTSRSTAAGPIIELIDLSMRFRQQMVLRNLTLRPERMASSYREHAAIAAAVIRGQGARAADHVRTHLDYGRTLVLGRPATN